MALKLTLRTARVAFTTLTVAWLALVTAACAERAVGPDSETSATGAWIAGSAVPTELRLSSTGAAHCWGLLVRVQLLGHRLRSRFAAEEARWRAHLLHLALQRRLSLRREHDARSVLLGESTRDRSSLCHDEFHRALRVAIPAPVREVAAGYRHACALTDAGAAYCWGDATLGRLGFEGTGGESMLPQRVNTQLAFSTVSAGTTQTCAIASDGDAYCWGGAYGTLGVGARDTSYAFAESCSLPPPHCA